MAFELKHSNLLSIIPEDEKSKPQNQNSNYIMINTSGGPKNLLDLDGFLNYVSSN